MEKSKKIHLGSENIKQLYSEYGIVMVLILLIIVATALNPIFISGSNIMNVLRQVSINGILSIGMTFVIISGLGWFRLYWQGLPLACWWAW